MSGGKITIKVDGDEISVTQQYSYTGDTNLSDLLPIMGLNEGIGFNIIDEKEHLTMLHYNEGIEAELMNKVGHVRGTLIDTEKKVIVGSSYGHTPICIKNEIEEGRYVFEDVDGIVHTFTNPVIRPVFDGVVMRAIRNKGENYLLSHKKIVTNKSRWGNSKTFPNMYKEAGGPTFEELFDQSKPYSTTCYYFLVVHPELLLATRQSVDAPYVMLLDAEEMFEEDLDSTKGIYSPPEFRTLGSKVNESGVYLPFEMNLEQANNHLKNGYYKPIDVVDSRLSLGESVIMYEKVNGKMKDIVRINSSGYSWRFGMRANNSNPYHRMFELFDSDTKPIPFTVDPGTFRKFCETRTILAPQITDSASCSRVEMLWMNYVVSLPVSFQKEANNYLDKYKSDIQGTFDGLVRIEKERLEKKEDCPFVVRTLVKNLRNESKKGEYQNKLEMHLKKMKRTDLYILIKNVREFLN